MPTFSVRENFPVAADVWRMTLVGATPALASGSFVEVALPNCYLRRPFSVCASEKNSFTIIYKVVGKGTEIMTHFAEGHDVDVITGLGNGFDESRVRRKALLVGGGLGVAPLYQLALNLRSRGVKCVFVGGFNSEKDIFLRNEFETICDEARYATMDGSFGHQGLVTELISDVDYDYFYSCGPLPMLKALSKVALTSGQLSLEARMGCGYGVCMGCSIETAQGPQRVCKEGPVFDKEVLLW